MKVTILREAGYDEALLGLSLSYNRAVEEMPEVAEKLLARGGSHVKFLESIAVWLDITAPRYWWQQFDTYRVGVSKQSESTMHTILSKSLSQENFEGYIPLDTIQRLNALISYEAFELVKNKLPEGFLQRRIVCCNYKVLSHIYGQRKDHRLKQWHIFFDSVLAQVQHPNFVTLGKEHNINDAT